MDLTKYKNLEGEFIELREMVLDDAEIIYDWRSGPSGKLMGQPENYSLEGQKKWMQNRPDNEINYMIVSKETGKRVGMIGILAINPHDKNAYLGRLLVAPEFLTQSTPFGLEALKLCCSLILNEWKFLKVNGDVLSGNQPMLKLQKYLGMKEEGLLKQQKIIDGNAYDLHLVALFADNLNKTYIPRINIFLNSFRN